MDTARGFEYGDNFLHWAERHGGAPRWLASSAGQMLALTFWYRQSPEYLIPWRTLSAGPLVRASDPDPDVPGMVGVSLDEQGRLLAFSAVPRQVEASPATPAHADWSLLLTAAGLDPAHLKTADPQWTPPQMADERAAWTGAIAGHADAPLRVEAAAWHGKPVWFALIYPWSKPYGSPSDKSPGQKAVNVLGIGLLLSVLVGAALLARRNWRLGRVDRRGALIVGVTFAIVNFASGSLYGKHVPGGEELILFLRTSSWCLYVGALVWMAYLALEPWVRRQWPHSIVSWTRLLAGRVRDPRVGADVLAGICFAIALQWLGESDTALSVRAGGLPDQTSDIILLGGRFAIVPWTTALAGSIVGTLGLFMLFFLCRIVARKFWLGCGLFVLLFVTIGTLTSTHPLIDVPFAIAVFSLMTFVMVRFGLVTFAAMSVINNVLNAYPLTWDFSAFYATSSLFALISIAVVAAVAFHYALGGRAIFGDDASG